MNVIKEIMNLIETFQVKKKKFKHNIVVRICKKVKKKKYKYIIFINYNNRKYLYAISCIYFT